LQYIESTALKAERIVKDVEFKGKMNSNEADEEENLKERIVVTES
jgi:hypothetical protein